MAYFDTGQKYDTQKIVGPGPPTNRLAFLLRRNGHSLQLSVCYCVKVHRGIIMNVKMRKVGQAAFRISANGLKNENLF